MQVIRRTQPSTTDESQLPFAKGAGTSQILRHNKGTIAALELMTKLIINAYRIASSTQGRLRGALTSQEIAKYVECCRKPGKVPSTDKCPNELLKTISGEEFLIMQAAWVHEIMTLPEKTIDTARQSRSTMNGTISQLHKGGSTNKTSEPTAQLHHQQSAEKNRGTDKCVRTRAGRGQAGRSVNINVQKMQFVTHEDHRQRKRVYRVDIDFRNAFNAMSQAALWHVMNMFYIPDVDLLEQIYYSTTVRLAPNDAESTTITFDTGGAQESILSPQLFNIFILAQLIRAQDCQSQRRRFDSGKKSKTRELKSTWI